MKTNITNNHRLDVFETLYMMFRKLPVPQLVKHQTVYDFSESQGLQWAPEGPGNFPS